MSKSGFNVVNISEKLQLDISRASMVEI
jgi:hypothetical protein